MALSDFKPMQERCSNCSFCKWIPFDKVKNARFAENCPSVCYHHFNTYSARGRFQIALAMVNGEKEVNGQMTDIAHACLSCGACDVSCKICRYIWSRWSTMLHLRHMLLKMEAFCLYRRL